MDQPTYRTRRSLRKNLHALFHCLIAAGNITRLWCQCILASNICVVAVSLVAMMMAMLKHGLASSEGRFISHGLSLEALLQIFTDPHRRLLGLGRYTCMQVCRHIHVADAICDSTTRHFGTIPLNMPRTSAWVMARWPFSGMMMRSWIGEGKLGNSLLATSLQLLISCLRGDSFNWK